jgi:hypothetical protein
MAILNEQSTMAIEVILSVPDNADGVVRYVNNMWAVGEEKLLC